MNVLFHINENNKWKTVLDNVSNMIKYCNDNAEDFNIEVLANGEAVISLKIEVCSNLKLLSVFNELSKQKAVFAACNNSLTKLAICKEELIPYVKIVPSGVIEIVNKQEEGYSYIKP